MTWTPGNMLATPHNNRGVTVITNMWWLHGLCEVIPAWKLTEQKKFYHYNNILSTQQHFIIKEVMATIMYNHKVLIAFPVAKYY